MKTLSTTVLLATIFCATLAHGHTGQQFKTGIRSKIRKLNPKGAKIYYHIDLDGITSALAMKHYLKKEGITRFEFEAIQYGDREYAIVKAKPGWMAVLVDFAALPPAP